LLTAAAAVLGLILGIAAAFLLEFLESAVIRRREDFTQSDIPLLASIPK
jgi:capsular polysaccharide biosynthesis protein